MSLTVPAGDKPSKWRASDPWSEVKTTPGAFPTSPNLESDWEWTENRSINATVRARRDEYVQRKNVTIKIGTWNVASMSGTEKDLAGWFIKGGGVKGLAQDLCGLRADDDSSSGSIESIEDQEERRSRTDSTLPRNDKSAVVSDDDVDIYVLGLQEVIDVSSVTEAMRPYYDPNPAKKWKHAVRRATPTGYKKVAEIQLLGLLLLIFASSKVADEVSCVDCQSVGTGLMGYVGNKGAVGARLVLGGTTRLLFVNCHLAAGADEAALKRRIWDTQQVLTRMRFSASVVDGLKSDTEHETIGDEDFGFWFGDLNYRLDDIPGEDVRRLLLLHTRNEYDIVNKSRRMIDSELGYTTTSDDDRTSDEHSGSSTHPKQYSTKPEVADPPLNPKDDPASLQTTLDSLLLHDQLRGQQRQGRAFHEGWREGEIGFLPTYKYDVGSIGMFDSGEKRRSPSWCDRILYRTRRDRENYLARAKQRLEARQKDADMKARGVDKDAADQEVLFDYDPAKDAADDYDEYEDVQETSHDVQHVTTKDGFEDIIELQEYVSHQRVLSSDHKPLTAVFAIGYDAVVPDLRAKIHQEVTRQFDKSENEARPGVTVVVENSPGGPAPADKSTGATELNDVEFESVRYKVPSRHYLTIANTSPIETTFAFIDRPSSDGAKSKTSPDWLDIIVHHDHDASIGNREELGASKRFTLHPGEIASVELLVNVSDQELTHSLNEEVSFLDEILVLRVLDGRDHFIRVKGRWLPTAMCRTLRELVCISDGVRHANDKETKTAKSPSSDKKMYHSAPKELFMLTEDLPRLVEDAAAEWGMLKENESPPWLSNLTWPFTSRGGTGSDLELFRSRQAQVREALDTGVPLTQYLDDELSSDLRAELIGATLLDFLWSLRDGIVTNQLWSRMEEQLVIMEKSKQIDEDQPIQEMVMEHLSGDPIHSVSFTFITFMVARLISELVANHDDTVKTPQTPQTPDLSAHSRSSTEVSETSQLGSMVSIESLRSKASFRFPNLMRRRPDFASPNTPTSPITFTMRPDRRKHLISAYAEKLAPAIIRSNQDTKIKDRDRKLTEARKRRVLEACLDTGPI